MAEEEPKIHVDADWKAQAQQEKQKLAEQEKAKSGESGQQEQGEQGQQGMPPANFETLISTMATQALFAMGAIPDPRTGQASVSIELARHHIDMLGVIEEKTQGNLTKEESDMLAGTLHELRTRYVQVAEALQQQAQGQGGQAGQGGQGGPAQGGAGQGPIQTG